MHRVPDVLAGLLHVVLEVLSGLLQIGLGLIHPALVLELLIVGDLAGPLLDLSPQLLGGVLRVIGSAHCVPPLVCVVGHTLAGPPSDRDGVDEHARRRYRARLERTLVGT